MDTLLKFFLLTYAVTWSCWGVAAVWLREAPAAVRGLVVLAGVFAPGMVAVWLTWRSGGGAGVRALLRRLVQWRAGVQWYVFAAGYMAAIKVTAALAHRALTGGWPRFGPEAWYVMLAATIFSTVIGGQVGEELGWRGYALPRMATRLGLGGASVLLGVIWACWHLPLFWIFPQADTYHQSFPVYLLQVTALSVAIAWLYGNTRGSLLLTMLMHSAINNTKDIVPSAAAGATHTFALSVSLVAWLTVALLWICGAYFLARMPEPVCGD